MKGLRRDIFFVFGVFVLCLAQLDFWAWDRVAPLLWGWIPYHLWYAGLLTLAGAAFFFWWGIKGWPDPPDDWAG